MNLPETMTYIAARGVGGPEVLELATGALPVPGAGEVLIRVNAAGVNRPDVAQRMGAYPVPPGANPVIGLEVAGEIAAVGAGVTSWRVGERVCALTNGGGYAQYCAVPAGQCLPWPSAYDSIQAAALPETYFTVWANLFQLGRLSTGQCVLIHGGTSGIGVTAIQLAVAFGARVFATAGSDEKCAACRRLGADEAINYRTTDFAARIEQVTQGRGVDVVLDMVGAAYFERNVRSLAPDGRLVLIAFLQGSKLAEWDLMPLLLRRLTVTGSTMRARSAVQKAALAQALRKEVWPLLDAGRCSPPIDRVFDLEQAADAHRLMESSKHIGKIVLRVTR